MLFKSSKVISIFAILSGLAAALPTEPASQCNPQQAKCCQKVEQSDTKPMSSLLGLLGVVVQAAVPIGLDCSPLSVIGVGSGNKCNAQPVCCTGNQFNGLVNVGCTPISV